MTALGGRYIVSGAVSRLKILPDGPVIRQIRGYGAGWAEVRWLTLSGAPTAVCMRFLGQDDGLTSFLRPYALSRVKYCHRVAHLLSLSWHILEVTQTRGETQSWLLQKGG